MDLRKSYFCGKYIQGNNAIDELPELINLYGGKAFMLVTPSMNKMCEEHKLVNANSHYEVFRGPCCFEEVERLQGIAEQGDYTVVVGIGGGKVVDTAKVIADKLDMHVIMVPTVAASSASFSACSVMYTRDNVEAGVYYEKHSPDVLLLDNSLLVGAKTRYFVAGMADALTTFFEARGCVQNGAPNSLHSRQTFIAMAMAEYCMETILDYGVIAKTDYENKIITPALERMLEINILGAGIAFEGTGLAASHAIHNGITTLPVHKDYLHGEIVNFGILSELHLKDSDPDELNRIYDFSEKVGLPTTFADLGMEGISDDQLMDVAKATYDDPYLHHDGVNITAEEIFYAMKAADAVGRARKGK